MCMQHPIVAGKPRSRLRSMELKKEHMITSHRHLTLLKNSNKNDFSQAPAIGHKSILKQMKE